MTDVFYVQARENLFGVSNISEPLPKFSNPPVHYALLSTFAHPQENTVIFVEGYAEPIAVISFPLMYCFFVQGPH
jgi:hypothetical protein